MDAERDMEQKYDEAQDRAHDMTTTELETEVDRLREKSVPRSVDDQIELEAYRDELDERTEEELGEVQFDDDADIINDPERLDRMVKEMLDDVDMYVEGEGPEGPWYYRTLTVRRIMNEIHVEDVDGRKYTRLKVPDMTRDDVTDDPHSALREKLDEVNEESLDEL